MQSGFYAGRRIRKQVERGEPATPAEQPSRSGTATFGSAAYSSRGHAVISVGRFHASGLIAGSPGGQSTSRSDDFRNRAGAILTWALAFSRESRRERAFTMQEIVAGEDVYRRSPPAATEQSPAPGENAMTDALPATRREQPRCCRLGSRWPSPSWSTSSWYPWVSPCRSSPW